MRPAVYQVIAASILLVGCASATSNPLPTASATTAIPATPTRRITMLPTWTPAHTPIPLATHTPRSTSTPMVAARTLPSIGAGLKTEMLIDRATNAQEPKPADLVSMQYDPNTWSLNTSYPTEEMAYSLSHRTIYGCKLEPVVGVDAEGNEVEKYSRSLGATRFDIARVSQAGILLFADYCTGEGDTSTCYKMSPGDDHEGCTQAAEAVLGSYRLISNPFYASTVQPVNRWACQDAAGTVGLCQVSYSVPLNALAFTPDGQAWAAGEHGILLHREGQAWKEVSSPASHALYDLHFTSAANGWAVGDGAQVLHWDGTAWSETLPYHGKGEGPGGSTQVLYAVDAYSANDAWMVGVMKGIDGKNSPYALHWNGKDMLEESAFPACNCGLNAVLMRGRNDVYAVGGSDLGAIIFHWDGSAWTSTQVSGADHLYVISQAADGSIWAGGIEVRRDLKDARGALFHWDSYQWQRVALPPLSGGIYALSALSSGQIVVGGEFTALRSGLEWQPISTDIAGYQWIVDIEQDAQNYVWALTRSGNIFQLGISR